MSEVIYVHLREYAHECSLCGEYGLHSKCVPYYEEPVATFEDSQGGGKTVCDNCYSDWLKKFPEESKDASFSGTNRS